MFSRFFKLTSVAILSLGFVLTSCGLIKEKELLEGKVLYNQPYQWVSDKSLSYTFEEGNILKLKNSDDYSYESTITEVIEKENDEYDVSLKFKSVSYKGIESTFLDNFICTGFTCPQDESTITVKVSEDKKTINVEDAKFIFPLTFKIDNND